MLETIKVITEAGMTGITVLLIGYIYKKDKMNNKIINNHFEHDTIAREKLAKAITKLSTVVGGCKFNKLNK